MTDLRLQLAERIVVALATSPLDRDSIVSFAVDLADEAYDAFERKGWLTYEPAAPLPPGVAPPPPTNGTIWAGQAPPPPRRQTFDLDDEIPF